MTTKGYLSVILACVVVVSSADRIKPNWWLPQGNAFTRSFQAQPANSESMALNCICVTPPECADTTRNRIRCGDGQTVCCQSIRPMANGPGVAVPQMIGPNTAPRDTPETYIARPPPPGDFIGVGGRPVIDKTSCGLSTPEFNTDNKGVRRDGVALENEFPWMLHVLEEPNYSLCPAVLYYPSVAITTAYCVNGKNKKKLKVVAGEWVLNTAEEARPLLERKVVDVIVHPDYQEKGLYSDMAMLVLEPTLPIQENVRPICTTPEKWVYPCFATGWGSRNREVLPDRNVMKKVQLKLIKANECTTILREVMGNRFNLSDTNFCASAKGADTELGDGGGPLFCQAETKPEHYTLVGITSWGKFDYKGTPGVYVAIDKFRSWIEEQLMD